MSKSSKTYVPNVALALLDIQNADDNIVSATTNIIIGKRSGESLGSGAINNVLLGHDTGNSITSGKGNVYIGNHTDPFVSETNKLRVGSSESSTDLIVGTFGSSIVNQSLTFNGAVTCASNLTITGNTKIKTSAPTTPLAGHIWIEGSTLKFVSSGGVPQTLNP